MQNANSSNTQCHIGPRVVSSRFCALDSDVTFLSADGVRFYLHKRNLETNTGGFPPAEIETRDEIVSLTEDSSILELLFQFIYPAQHPKLVDTPFETLLLLAEAAEKYEVYSAMNICNIRMQLVLPKHADMIVTYAVKHDYQDILRVAAPLMLHKSLDEIVSKMPVNLIIPWVRYYQFWNRALQHAISYPNNWQISQAVACNRSAGSGICVSILRIMCKLNSVQSLQDLDAVFNNPSICCNDTPPMIVSWRRSVEASIKGIPEFSSFCRAAVS